MQDKDNQKNLLLAIVLSVAVLLAWQFFYAGPKLKEEQERQARSQQEQTQTSQTGRRPPRRRSDDRRAPLPASSGTAAAVLDSDTGGLPRGRAAGKPARADRDAQHAGLDRAEGRPHRRRRARQISRDGGSRQPQRRAVLAFGRAASLLCRIRLGRRPPASTQPMPDAETLWRAEKGGSLTPGSPVTLVWDNGQGLRVPPHDHCR